MVYEKIQIKEVTSCNSREVELVSVDHFVEYACIAATTNKSNQALTFIDAQGQPARGGGPSDWQGLTFIKLNKSRESVANFYEIKN